MRLAKAAGPDARGLVGHGGAWRFVLKATGSIGGPSSYAEFTFADHGTLLEWWRCVE